MNILSGHFCMCLLELCIHKWLVKFYLFDYFKDAWLIKLNVCFTSRGQDAIFHIDIWSYTVNVFFERYLKFNELKRLLKKQKVYKAKEKFTYINIQLQKTISKFSIHVKRQGNNSEWENIIIISCYILDLVACPAYGFHQQKQITLWSNCMYEH